MARNAQDIQMRKLKDLLNELRETSRLLRTALEETRKEKSVLKQERDSFKEQADYLTKKLSGSSSEKGACDTGQMNLFNEAESETDPAVRASGVCAAAKPPESELPENKVKKKRSSNEECFKGIPVKKVFLEPSGEEHICSKCGKQMDQIGTEFVRRELKIIPAKAIVIEYRSINYGCKNCKEHGITPAIIKGRDGKARMMYGMASASTVARVVYQKYCNRMPLYRIEQDPGRLGAEISRAAPADWVIKNTEAFFAPMYGYFHRKLLARNFALADETPVQVLHEPERRAQTESYMRLFRSGEDGDLRSSSTSIPKHVQVIRQQIS